ncbi:radical SAM protein [Desulfococcaceae bacterium HSG8]|nr:radical SAM protein [Desulfococcaceae bacterium HSG8]
MKVLLLQLPIPQYNYGKQTGNIPLGAACLRQAAADLRDIHIRILPESLTSYLGDAAITDLIRSENPDILGFTIYSWNIERSLYISREIKMHGNPRIIFGGPEVTPDNPLPDSECVDFRVYGEGEAVFLELLREPSLWKRKYASLGADSFFRSTRSPYLCKLLEPEIENMILIETQRGCPYRCRYCYYNKSRGRVSAVSEDLVLEGIQWAYDRGIAEAYLLDPSLNARPRLKKLLRGIAEINSDQRMSLRSEIRAEAITPQLAEQFVLAGFQEFEIGLQSTNPEALRQMNRPTDLEHFRQGVKNLQNAGIRFQLDLILGLPGDDLEGFRSSVDFVAANDIHQDVHVFFLSVLPGTDFRRKSGELGLRYEPRPPYTIIETPGFSQDDMVSGFFYAEDAFGIALQPEPDLDLSYRDGETVMVEFPACGIHAHTGFGPYLSKIVMETVLPISRLENMTRRLSQPYQIIFMPSLENRAFMLKAVSIFSDKNPFTPLEMVFMEPRILPDIEAFEASLELRRPLYLDLDIPALGTGSVIYTLVSSARDPRFGGLMKRQVFRWQSDRLPETGELEELFSLDGVLMDNTLPANIWEKWQDVFANRADDLPLLTFADVSLQRRWDQLR